MIVTMFTDKKVFWFHVNFPEHWHVFLNSFITHFDKQTLANALIFSLSGAANVEEPSSVEV